jgi:hypothetical protein
MGNCSANLRVGMREVRRDRRKRDIRSGGPASEALAYIPAQARAATGARDRE